MKVVFKIAVVLLPETTDVPDKVHVNNITDLDFSSYEDAEGNLDTLPKGIYMIEKKYDID